jgi:hypothetical protein
MEPANDCPQVIYEIRVQGELDQDWETWFGGLDVVLAQTSDQMTVTTMLGPVPDQAALRGMLCKLWDLNLTLISVRRIEADHNKEETRG